MTAKQTSNVVSPGRARDQTNGGDKIWLNDTESSWMKPRSGDNLNMNEQQNIYFL